MHTLHQRLTQEQAIPFVEFMQCVLYAPLDGYYSSGLRKFGQGGDFITAPELTPLFGQTLAKQCQQIMTHLKEPVILEYGAGTGKLAVDILKQLEVFNCLPKQYLILEVSANLRHCQEEWIRQSIPHLASRVIWLNSLPKTAFEGVILANEVLDAMPVHRFMHTQEGIRESHVALNNKNELIEQFLPCQNQALLAYIQEHLALDPLPYLSEANLFLEGWISNNYQMLQKGAMILMDYGFPRHEYYHPDRNQGTLMCHYQHRAHSNPLLHPGEQDITAHVDFTRVAEAGHQAGFHIAGFTNQASFLLSNDLLSFVDLQNDSKLQFQASQAIKRLTLPSEMGELFKVMALSKGLDCDLQGFQLQDKRVSL